MLGVLMVAVAFLFSIEHQIGVLIAASVLIEAGVGLAIPGMIATVIERAPPSSRGLGIGIYACILFLGASLGSPIGNLLGQSGPLSFYLIPMLLLCAAAFVLARVSYFRVRSYALEQPSGAG